MKFKNLIVLMLAIAICQDRGCDGTRCYYPESFTESGSCIEFDLFEQTNIFDERLPDAHYKLCGSYLVKK